MQEFVSTSLEYVRVPIGATEAGADVDLSDTTVMLAFLVEGSTAPAAASVDWKAAGWETDPTTSPPTYYARALIGPNPGVVQLVEGIYDVWAKVTDLPEVMIRQAETPIRVTD